MAELSVADVEGYTRGRLLASDPETAKILSRALAAARSYCEWHVTPPKSDVVTLDGSGNRLQMLPTLNVVTLASVVEDGISLPIGNLEMSAGGPVRLRKKTGTVGAPCGLRWSSHYSSIVVTMTHGFAEVDAADFQMAVLDTCDRFSLEVGRGGLQRFEVDDVRLFWFERHEAMNTNLLEEYRLVAPA